MRLTRMGNTDLRFYRRKIRSGWKLAANQSGFNFFQEKEASSRERNYDYNKNFFRHNRGNILYLRGNVWFPDYAPVQMTDTIANINIRMKALNQLLALTDVQIRVEDGRDHECRLIDLTGPMPGLLHETAGGNIAMMRDTDVNGTVQTALRRGDAFAPVIIIDTDRVPVIDAQLPATYTLGSGDLVAAIYDHIIELELVIEEYPQDQVAITRPAS